MKPIISVYEIVKAYINNNGYDGLFNADGECACEKDDLDPCGEMSGECYAGYKFPCDCGDHDYHIGSWEEKIEAEREMP